MKKSISNYVYIRYGENRFKYRKEDGFDACDFGLSETESEFYKNTKLLLEEKRLADEAGDRSFARLLRLCRPLPKTLAQPILQRAMQSPRRQKLYEHIWNKVAAASNRYGSRDYGEAVNAQIAEQRRQAAKTLERLGYAGAYPDFAKGNRRIHVCEEHPFTTMEYENYEFKIQLMVSETEEEGLNAGFFRGRGCRGEIMKLEDLSC